MKSFSFLTAFLIGISALVAEEAFIYDSHGRRDPFVPLVGAGIKYIPSNLEELAGETSQASNGAFMLNGILWDPNGECIVVINGEICMVNDEIGKYRITAIKENMVILSDKEGNEKSLVLYREEDENVNDK